MRIHHSRRGREFASIPNETLRDERLSLAARGQLAYLLSLPDGWTATADAESRRARAARGRRGEGRDAMRNIYAELKAAGYISYEHTQADDGTWSTTIHVYDLPHADVRVTGIPESRMSVPPAQTPEPVDNSAEFPQASEFPQFAPTYGSPGVGTPAVGTPVHRPAVHSYEDRTTEDGENEGRDVGDPIADKEQPNANSLPRVHVGPDNGADDAQQIPPNDSESPAADRYARARPPLAGHRWRSQQEIAAGQVAEARALREAAEAATPWLGATSASPGV